MVNIKFDMYNQLSGYDDIDTIILGKEIKIAYNNLSTNDFNKHFSNTITHELIHHILNKEFNLTTCKLFDAIEHNIEGYELKEHVFSIIRKLRNSKLPITWRTHILNSGFDAFRFDYDIMESSINQAYVLCNER